MVRVDGAERLVLASDPITFPTADPGWQAVIINANDVAATGGEPRWFLSTVIAPPGATEEDLAHVAEGISRGCREVGATPVGGHTEVSPAVDRIVVSGVMAGPATPERIKPSGGAREGDMLLVTKGVAIEATAVVAEAMAAEVTAAFGEDFRQSCLAFVRDPGISVAPEARVAAGVSEVHAMHDVTEGGIATAIREMAEAAGLGVIVAETEIPRFHESKRLLEHFGLDPLGAIGSGALLIACAEDATGDLLDRIADAGVAAHVIGRFVRASAGLKLLRGANRRDLPRFAADEITRLASLSPRLAPALARAEVRAGYTPRPPVAMRLVVLGAGQMGEHLLRHLSRSPERHDVTLVELDPDTRAHFERKYDIAAAEGDAGVATVLLEHGEGADVLFALTNSDATNLLAAVTATDPAIGVRRAVVRLSDHRHRNNPLLGRDGREASVATIFPEDLVAREILGIIRHPGALSFRSFADGALSLVRARPQREFVFGKAIQDLDVAPQRWIVTGILRKQASGQTGVTGLLGPADEGGEPRELHIPRGDSRVEDGDEIFAVGPTHSAGDFLDAIGSTGRPARRVVVAGLGQVGRRLTEFLLDAEVDVTVIKHRPSRKVSVPAPTIVGDAAQEDILAEAEVEGADFFVAATGTDEVNLMAACLARKLGARRTIALHNRDDLREVLQTLGVDHPISPGVITAGELMRQLHSRALVRLDWVGSGGELVEIEVAEGSPATRAPLAVLDFPRDAIVGEVRRPDMAPFVPNGDYRFRAGETVVLFIRAGGENPDAERELLEALERLFGRP